LPNLRDIQRSGRYTRAYVGGDSSTYTATPTVSAPGYMNLITGTWGNKHNVFDNDVRAPNYHYKNIFRLLKEQQPARKIGIFSTWTNNSVKLIGERLSTAGNIIFDYKFDGYELDQQTYPHDSAKRYIHNIDERVIHEASLCIANQAPDLSWIYLQYTDDMGHAFGDSPQFLQAVDFFDKQMGRIWQAIDYRRSNHNEDWLVIITTDHGRDSSSGRDHGDQSDRERTTWIVTNSPVTNMYSRQFQPAIVDILPTIARFMGLTIPLESDREIDGVPLLGKVSIVKPDASVIDNILTVKWQVVDDGGNVKIWLTTTNSFRDGTNERYDLVDTVPIVNKMATIDVTRYPSEFYKIVLEGQYNRVNRWASRKGKTFITPN
jgi:predicted AlkP superfamily pyrophosphatase or phosphodiesterase